MDYSDDPGYLYVTPEASFNRWLNKIKADVWDEGFTAGSDYVCELEAGSRSFELAEYWQNPYRTED